MSTPGKRREPTKPPTDSNLTGIVNERHTAEMFIFAGVVTSLAGVATWLYGISQWGTPAFVFSVVIMGIAWLAALIFLATLCVVRSVERAVRKCDKRLDKATSKLERRMSEHADHVEDSIRTSIQRGELAAYLDAVENATALPRQPRRLHPVGD